jgi:hypothetical protein
MEVGLHEAIQRACHDEGAIAIKVNGGDQGDAGVDGHDTFP